MVLALQAQLNSVHGELPPDTQLEHLYNNNISVCLPRKYSPEKMVKFESLKSLLHLSLSF